MTEVEGPLFVDFCEHGEGCYVGTTEMEYPQILGDVLIARHDVYVFPDEWFGQLVCLRYGDGEGDYVSPGTVESFIKSAGVHCAKGHQTEYMAALELLSKKGRICWQPLPVEGEGSDADQDLS